MTGSPCPSQTLTSSKTSQRQQKRTYLVDTRVFKKLPYEFCYKYNRNTLEINYSIGCLFQVLVIKTLFNTLKRILIKIYIPIIYLQLKTETEEKTIC